MCTDENKRTSNSDLKQAKENAFLPSLLNLLNLKHLDLRELLHCLLKLMTEAIKCAELQYS